MGRRNARLKPSCLVFGPKGFAGVPEGLALQTLPTLEQKAQIVGSRGNPRLNRRSGCQWDEVASIPIEKRLASLRILAIPLIQNHFSTQWLSNQVLHRPVETALPSRACHLR